MPRSRPASDLPSAWFDLTLGDVLPIKRWETPATQIPEQRAGKWRVVKEVVRTGTSLPMYGVLGYDEAYFLEDAVITVLKEGRRVWASDTPREYYSMWELAARARGPRVLIGGLGLGMLANILALRRDVKAITVVELSPEVIEMVGPYVPSWVEVVEGDFFDAVRGFAKSGKRYDTVVVDIFAGGSEKDRRLYNAAKKLLREAYPDSVHLFWAFQRDHDAEEILRFTRRARA